MNISLSPELEQLIQKKVESGIYASVNDVIREGLMLLEERDLLKELKLRELKKDIQAGIESGESIPLDIEAIKAEAKRTFSKGD